MNNENDRTVGSELVQRLEQFAKQLESAESLDSLSTFLTVRTVKADLQPVAYTSEEVKSIRESLQISQAVFAEFLGVSLGAVRDWEQKVNQPIGPVCRILQEMSNDLEAWSRRIRQLADTTASC